MRKFFRKKVSSQGQPADSQPFRSRGDDLAKLGDYNGAVVMYNAALLNAPNDRDLLSSRSVAYSMSTPPKLDFASKDADDIIQLNPRWWQGWLRKGEVLFKSGNFKRAEEALTYALGFANSNDDKERVRKVLDDVRACQLSSLAPNETSQALGMAPNITHPPSTTPANKGTAAVPSEGLAVENAAQPTDFEVLTDKTLDTPPAYTSKLEHLDFFDHPATIARLIPKDSHLDTVEETRHTWEIASWRKLALKEYGPVFECGGSPWQIMLHPQGNNVNYVSLYFQRHGQPEKDWYSCVQFGVVMWNPKQPSKYVSLAAKHRFNVDEMDWGFTRFLDLKKLAQPWDGHDSPLIDNDEINITVYVRVIKDPTGVLWHNFFNYNSAKETGMVGLRNQGATGYLNVVLQNLYLTNSVRKAIYQISTEENARTDFAWSLQRLFYALQTSDSAVPTRELTTSFGWGPLQAFEQQDVREMSEYLMQQLRLRTRGTPVEKQLSGHFNGELKKYIICADVGYEEATFQGFGEIELNTGGRSLEEGLRAYSHLKKVEKQVNAGHPYGLQDAERGIIFSHLPPVLQIYLKQLQYSPESDTLIKTNNYLEYPEEFDAAPYLSTDTDKSEPWTYRLAGVTVHSGSVSEGQYYTFRRPTKDGPFYKFDDDRVTRATLREVMDENFGGEGSRLDAGIRANRDGSQRSRNAYLLVYIRKSRLDSVLGDVREEDVPEHIRKQTAREHAELAQRKK